MKTIKQLLITVAMLLCSVVANAYDFEVNGIYYNIISTSDLTVEVTNGDNKYSGEVIIPETIAYKSKVLKVTSIGDEAFSNCTGLTSIEIPNSVTSIGDWAFTACRSLKDLRIEDGEKTLSLGENFYKGGLFYDCPLESLYLGRNLDYNTSSNSGYSPFCGITTLTSVTIGNNVTNIGDYAFSDCYGLTNVVIGNSVTSIGNYAFSACDSLTSIYLLSETPPTVGSNNFTNKQYMNMIVYVPKGTLATYQAADTWKNFWDIQEFDVTAIENVEDVTPAFEITSSGIQFTAADGKAIAIYAPNGALVEKIDNYAGEEITLDKGVYIVRVGNKTTKVKL